MMKGKKGVVVSHVVVKGELLLLLPVAICCHKVMKGSYDHCQGESWSLLFIIVR